MSRPLNSYKAWQESLRNFEWLNEVVPGAMDVDVMVERHGKFLVLEGKRWASGVDVPYGQHRALLALSKVPQFRVYLVGEGEERLHLLDYRRAFAGRPRKVGRILKVWLPPDLFIPSNPDGLRALVKGWWDDA